MIEVYIIACVVSVAFLVVRDHRLGAPRPGVRRLELWPWLALLLTFAVSWVMMAKHVSGGGNPHVRYLIIALPLIGVAIGTALVRIHVARAWGRYLPSALAAIALLGLFAVRVQQTVKFVDWMPKNTDAPPTSVLSLPSGPGWARIAALALGTLGVALMTSIIAVLASRPHPAAAGPDDAADP
jgi:hypothetical protein